MVGSVAAQCEQENKPCNRICARGMKDCSFNCGKSKNCSQGCIEKTCNDMTCSTGSCTQFCYDCESKIHMVCSAPNCVQTCKASEGGSCEMECTQEVEVCSQICEANSTCKMTCRDSNKTTCERSCADGATCTILPEKPLIVRLCDEDGNCSISCTGECGEETITCDDSVKECNLNCEKGCKMKCGKNVENCSVKCDGDIPCSRECEAKKCSSTGIFTPSSSAVVCQLNYFIFALFTFIMIFWL